MPINKPLAGTYSSLETGQIISKIFNLSPEVIVKNLHFFSDTHPYIRNCLIYLSRMESDEMLLNACHSLEFVLTFNRRIDENETSKKS